MTTLNVKILLAGWCSFPNFGIPLPSLARGKFPLWFSWLGVCLQGLDMVLWASAMETRWPCTHRSLVCQAERQWPVGRIHCSVWPPAGRHDTQNVAPYAKWIANDYKTCFCKGFSLILGIVACCVLLRTDKALGRIRSVIHKGQLGIKFSMLSSYYIYTYINLMKHNRDFTFLRSCLSLVSKFVLWC